MFRKRLLVSACVVVLVAQLVELLDRHCAALHEQIVIDFVGVLQRRRIGVIGRVAGLRDRHIDREERRIGHAIQAEDIAGRVGNCNDKFGFDTGRQADRSASLIGLSN